VNSLIALAEPVEAHFRWRPALRDPADEMVLETVANVFNRLNITTRQVAGEWLKSMAAKEWMENQVISH
jgi:hypothetical protein